MCRWVRFPACLPPIFGERRNEGFALLAVVPAVCQYAGGNVFHPPYRFFCLAATATLSRRAQIVMEAAPGCVLISVIAPISVSNKPHELIAIALTVLSRQQVFYVGYRVDRCGQFWAVGVFNALGGCV